jgi:hypothetical protein
MDRLQEILAAFCEETLLEERKKKRRYVKSQDQDDDGDNDFADVMIKRRTASGEDLPTAIKKTRKFDK